MAEHKQRPSGLLSSRPECVNGHKTAEENIYRQANGREWCRQCRAAAEERRRGKVRDRTPRRKTIDGMCKKGLHEKETLGRCRPCHIAYQSAYRKNEAAPATRVAEGTTRIQILFGCGEVGFYPQAPTNNEELLYCHAHNEWDKVQEWVVVSRPVFQEESNYHYRRTLRVSKELEPQGPIRSMRSGLVKKYSDIYPTRS